MTLVAIRQISVGFTVCRTKIKKKKYMCKGPKWDGLLPISSLGSRHYSGVATGGTVVCTTGAPARTTKDMGTC